MAMSHEVTLRLSGTFSAGDGHRDRTRTFQDFALDAWDSYAVTLDMFAPGCPWTFALWRSTAAQGSNGRTTNTWQTLIENAHLGTRMTLAIDGAPQLNGIIEDVEYPVTRDKGAGIVISGRSLVGLAMDPATADPRVQLYKKPLDDALQELFNRVGIYVHVGVHADEDREIRSRARPGARGSTATTRRRRRKHPVDLSHPRPGESVWQVAESIVKRMGYMMWPAPCVSDVEGQDQMGLVVDAPAVDYDNFVYRLRRREVDGFIEAGSNILDGKLKLSLAGVPARVYAMGQAPRGDGKPGSHTAPFVNQALAAADFVDKPLFPKPYWLHASRAKTLEQTEKEAEKVCVESMRQWRTYTATVQGHGQIIDGAMRLYAINTCARVYDRIGGVVLLDESMLITRIEFRGGRSSGQTTTLTLSDKEAMRMTPRPED